MGIALIDSGATKNFMQLLYVKKLQLPIKEMLEPQMVFNVNGMPNKSGEIKYYTDINVQTRQNYMTFQFFLTSIGDRAILRYPWMSATQSCIDWRKGWINHEHLPIVFQVPGLHHKPFIQKDNN